MALALPCRSADEALSPEQPKRRACRGEVWPWGSIPAAGGIGAFTPSCGFVGRFQEICMLHELVCLPQGGTAWRLLRRDRGSLSTSAIQRGSLQELHRLWAEAGGTGGCFS